MKHQRVLYIDRLTADIQTKLRIISYDKRRSLKGNVYFVRFASNTDMKAADRIAKRLPNITLKPIQISLPDSQRSHRINVCRNQASRLSNSSSSSIQVFSSPIPFLSPPYFLSFLPNSNLGSITTPQLSPIERGNETLEERARRILGSHVEIDQNDEPIPTLQPPNFIHSGADINSNNNHINQYEKDKKQLFDNLQSCLTAMEITRRASDHLYQLHSKTLPFSFNRTI